MKRWLVTRVARLNSMVTYLDSLTMVGSVMVGWVLRMGLLMYGQWQDTCFQVKYTDVDYHVFQEAGRAVQEGHSPYSRVTYRYTPGLSYFMNWMDQVWVNFLPWVGLGSGSGSGWSSSSSSSLAWGGKVLFILMDLGVAVYLMDLLPPQRNETHASQTSRKDQQAWRWRSIKVGWLWNPWVATISTRGNAEALVNFACVALVAHLFRACKHLEKKKKKTHPPLPIPSTTTTTTGILHFILSAGWWGWAVHLKMYPIIYMVPLFRYLQCHPLIRGRSWPTMGMYFFMAGTVFMSAFMYFYFNEGMDFVKHTYMYHVTRLDHRHNFSVYAYALALVGHDGSKAWVHTYLPFIAQAVGVGVLGCVFPATHLVEAMFAQTVYFVAVNKVVTSQYFMWYLCYLPIVLPHFVEYYEKTPSQGVFLLMSWLGAQVTLFFFFFFFL
ncbi:GPI mannosyltransferase 1 [Coelomomyces lativittatus]|nr:GPI mannosyltransferase 1 [Coelomomyces lativittatus]